MKTTHVLLLGLLILGAAVAVPAASAHIIVTSRDENGNCTITHVGDPRIGPHGFVNTDGCQAYHFGPLL